MLHRRWLESLESPLELAGRRLRNRLMMSALTLQYGADGLVTDRHTGFYAARARGGVGLIFSEQFTASPLSESPFGHALRAYDPRQPTALRRMLDVVEPLGAAFFAQLFCAGAAGHSTVGLHPWGPLRGPSQVPAPGGEVPLPFEGTEMGQLIADFADSAARLVEAGVHGIEIHGAHGWLVGQFLSPFYNRRIDEFGGSVAGRCELALRIARAIRAAIGPRVPLGIALTYDELLGPAGITEEDALAQMHVFLEADVFDFFNLSIGSSHQQHFTIASMAVAEGFTLAFAAKAKHAAGTRAAIFISGRIVDAFMAGRAVMERKADVVGMTRALIADPDLLAKARAGASTVTRCVGANHCVSRALVDQPVACVLNPAAGREVDWNILPRARRRLSVRVIGAGPAGLTFAQAAGRLGHEVEVFEQEAFAGGHLAVLAQLPTRASWSNAVADQLNLLADVGGWIRLGERLEPAEATEGAPDVIAVATGSRWVVPEDPGAETPNAPSCWSLDQAIVQAVQTQGRGLGRRVLILDESGAFAPLGLADLLSAGGSQVFLATSQRSMGSVAAMELDLPHVMPQLAARGVEMKVECQFEGARSHCATLRGIWGGPPMEIADLDSIVFAQTRIPERTLFDTLRGRHSRVVCLGDALSPRSTAAVIHEAVVLARTLSES